MAKEVNISKRLARQIGKIFELEDPETELRRMSERAEAGVSGPEQHAQCIRFISRFPDFLHWVEETQQHQEEMLALSKRSLELSSSELHEKNLEISRMINSLGEGYLVFGEDGICLPTYSKACEQIFGMSPAAKDIVELLRIPEGQRAKFRDWLQLLFAEPLDFEDLVPLGPKVFTGADERHVALHFKPIREGMGEKDEGKIRQIVLIATDRSEQRKAELLEQRTREYAEMILKIARNRNQFRAMIQDLKRCLFRMGEILLAPPLDSESLKELFRLIHTVKGALAAFAMTEIKEFVHEFEEKHHAVVGSGWVAPESYFLLEAKEFILCVQRELEVFMKTHEDILGKNTDKSGMVREIPLSALHSFCADLLASVGEGELAKSFVQKLLSVPIHECLAQFDLTVQSTADRLQKKVYPLRFQGEDFPIFPENYEDVFASLVHVFRNSVDHGIESPDERKLRRKDPRGTIWVKTARTEQGDARWIELWIEDDGRGVDLRKLREKLRQIGSSKAADLESDEDIIQHVFDPGLSTQDEITDVSGRGVGLDAVKAAVDTIGGSVKAFCQEGMGLRIRILLPRFDVTHQLSRLRSSLEPRSDQ